MFCAPTSTRLKSAIAFSLTEIACSLSSYRAYTSRLQEKTIMSRRAKVTRFFLWISVIGWGIGLGAKLFDNFVLWSAYSLDPPASLAYLPYGPHFPHDPGEFFQPLSALIVPGVIGA